MNSISNGQQKPLEENLESIRIHEIRAWLYFGPFSYSDSEDETLEFRMKDNLFE